MRTRSNSTIGNIFQSAKKGARRLSLAPIISNRSETLDLESQIQEVEVNEEIIRIKQECVIRDVRRQRRDFNRKKSLSISKYLENEESVPYEEMGTIVITIFILFVITCLYFAEIEVAAYKEALQN